MAKHTKSSETMLGSLDSELNNLPLEKETNQLEVLKASIFNDMETTQAKIQFIKEEFLAGRYDICSERIAAKLLEYVPTSKELEPA